jgi:hypothetical protein
MPDEAANRFRRRANRSFIGASVTGRCRLSSVLESPSGMGETPRLQAKPSGGLRPDLLGSQCSRRASRLQSTRRTESLAFRRGSLNDGEIGDHSLEFSRRDGGQ